MFHVNYFTLSLPTTVSSEASLYAHSAYPSARHHLMQPQACDHLSKQDALSAHAARPQSGLADTGKACFVGRHVDVSAK